MILELALASEVARHSPVVRDLIQASRTMVSRAEERRLIRAWLDSSDHEARNTLVMVALGTCLRMAMNATPDSQLDADDLQEALLAVLLSADRWTDDPEKSLLGQIPLHISDSLFRNWLSRSIVPLVSARQTRRMYWQLRTLHLHASGITSGDAASSVSRITGTPLPVVAAATELLWNGHCPLDEVDRQAPDVWQVEMPADPGRGRLIAAALADLTDPRAADIMRRRFLCDEPDAFAVIGEDHGISGERVRQIMKHGLAEMRAWFEAKSIGADDLL